MSKRNYNVFFNTHTVSGIVISVALYIIFFAGGFSLFKDEIDVWQNGKHLTYTDREDIDFDKIIENVSKTHELLGRDLQINFGDVNDKIYLSLRPSKDSLASKKAKERDYFAIDINTGERKNYKAYYNLGEFLYRLHFFSQFPFIGIYLAGLVAFFFLFAIVTGIIVHWKKIVPNFYAFNPKIALKRVWTDAHTALGVIGLPFQFIFSITGAYFCLSFLILIPANFLYNGDQDKLLAELRPDRKNYEWIGKTDKEIPSFNQFTKNTVAKWDNFHVKRGFIKNYGGTNMKYIVSGDLVSKKSFLSTGFVILDVHSGKIELERDPNQSVYGQDIQRLMGRLHFADFGGIPIKLIYFVLSLITCFVIVTGVLIYVEARNKKSYTLKQRLYTTKIGHIYMAICLSMLPVTALAFLFVKLTNTYFIDKQTAIYSFYFIAWLLAILFFIFKRDNYYTNKVSLLFAAIFGFLIPICNGIISGNWIWVTYSQGQLDILLIDVLWIIIAAFSLLFYLKIKPQIKEKSAFTKNPIDYKNSKALIAEEATNLQTTQDHTENKTQKITDKNHIEMRTKIIILWLFLGLAWVVHHLYGLFSIYYNETLIMDGATGEAPLTHHIYRILFEGLCLLFALLTIEVSKQWFKWTAFIWAIIAGLYNVYHFVEALLFESSNISEIFILLLVSLASVFLVRNLFLWKKE